MAEVTDVSRSRRNVQITDVSRSRRNVQVTVRVRPARRGRRSTAVVTGRVRDGALVTANGMKWVFR